MSRRHVPRVALALSLVALAAVACERESRRFRDLPPGANAEPAVTQNDALQPGPMIRNPLVRHPYERNAWAIAEGKTLYNNMNCAGCHSPRGGGNIGPSLIDSVWIYGHELENLYQSIEQGRPRGMPAFRGRLGNTEIWKLAAYIRSMNGLTRQDTRSGRGDETHEASPDVQTERMAPISERIPPEEPDPHARGKQTQAPVTKQPTTTDTTRRGRPDEARKP